MKVVAWVLGAWCTGSFVVGLTYALGWWGMEPREKPRDR